MFGLPIFEVAIGLCFVYLLLALICTTINETLSGITRRRASLLENGILSLLGGDQNLKDSLYQHPLIASLATSQTKPRPSYIPASKFALALMDILTGSDPTNSSQALRAGISAVKTPLKSALTTVLADSNSNLPTDQQKIEAWFDEGMDRVSGWYKRRTVVWVWILAAAVTLCVNADTIRMAQLLWTNQAVRTAVVESAKARAQMERPEELLPTVEYTDAEKPNEGKPIEPAKNIALTDSESKLLGQLTGWDSTIQEWKSLPPQDHLIFSLRLALGLLMTMVAVSLGAPFWFDALNRFMNIRSAGRAPDEPRDKSS